MKIFLYLKKTNNQRIMIQRFKHFLLSNLYNLLLHLDLFNYIDSEYTGNINIKKSTNNYIFTVIKILIN